MRSIGERKNKRWKEGGRRTEERGSLNKEEGSR